MNIKPKTDVFFEPPSEGQRANYVKVFVSNDNARDIVNSFKDEPFLKGDSIRFSDDTDPIRKGRLDGWFVVNPCFNVDEVLKLITEAVEAT